jgi:hypothetical protein
VPRSRPIEASQPAETVTSLTGGLLACRMMSCEKQNPNSLAALLAQGIPGEHGNMQVGVLLMNPVFDIGAQWQLRMV